MLNKRIGTMKPLGTWLPLPTIFKKKIAHEIDKEKFLLNARDGLMAAVDHPCGKLYMLAKKYIRSFDIALDIGSRFGEFAYFTQKDFDHTISFDPLKTTAFFLNTHRDRVTHFKCALGDRVETIKMFAGCHSDSMNSQKPISFLKETKHFAQCVPLDYFIFDQSKEIGLIKIDVEGFEKKVLLGGWNTIKRNRPVIIIEQNHVHLSTEKPKEALRHLEKNGYEVKETYGEKEGKTTDYILVPTNLEIAKS